ncbi:fasciclin-like arabinogalactan protein 2 [Cornus florida]|uniref:fasciclin-like arabinogalactan protein 2 n=1 Tax=Cornus florida TaxID=4283 RepID=UPI00289EFDCF|nr:fasciclin-like arabinogalactan protein 2 [Cornus florida]
MQLPPVIIFSLLLFSLLSSTTQAHNITRILAKHPEFSTFNHYLTITHLAADINRRQTITVCAVDNGAMDELLSKHLSIFTIKNVLSLHIFADYFGSKKLHQLTGGSTLTATMYQATGNAPGTSGYVNITNLKGGKVGFAPEDNDGPFGSVYVKSVHELPYNISVIQISHVLTSTEAEAPAAGPSNISLTGLMSRQGCKAFSDLLLKSDAEKTFTENLESGLTVFCPSDGAINAFMPKYKNLTAAGKVSVLQYHGVPVYQSMGMLKSSNGLMNTLATDGSNKYDFTVQNDNDDVTLMTKVVSAKIMATLIDEEPIAVYKVNKVLLPRELFKADPAPAPKASKETDAAAPEPDTADSEAADQTATDNGSVSIGGGRLVTVVLGLCWGVLALL